MKHPPLARSWVVFALLALGLGRCAESFGGEGQSVAEAKPSGYFQTPFQTECEFIVRAIVSDLAEQMYFAAHHRLPDEKSFFVTATEKPRPPLPGPPVAEPPFALKVQLDPKQPRLDYNLVVNGPIWSPQVYEGVAKELGLAVSLTSNGAVPKEDTSLLVKLKEGTPEAIERENQRLSAALESDFRNPELHEEAAALIGAFLLRDQSGCFFNLRSPLSRLTAHLTMARFLRGSKSAGINGQMAEAMMLTLVGDQAQALERLNAISTNEAAALPWVRALRTRNTADYRPLDSQKALSRIESAAWFCAWADSVTAPIAWTKLNDNQKQTIDYVRAAQVRIHSVEMGHQLLAVSIPLEMQEIQSVYSLTHQEKPTKKSLISALNEPPDGCFTRAGDKAKVHVIGWGQWAQFLQRHLCNAIQENFYFINRKWGVPDEAKEFATQCEQAFDGLQLYPFVRRFTCTDVESYRRSVEDGYKLTVAVPHLVSAQCWRYLEYRVNFAPFYRPVLNPFWNEWLRNEVPPGTVYDVNARVELDNLRIHMSNTARYEQFHKLAPYNADISNYLIKDKYDDQPSYDQAVAVLEPILPYNTRAMRRVARTVQDKPDKYEKIMLEAAKLDPLAFYGLADNAIRNQREDQGANYLDQACAADPDSVGVASRALWRVKYYLRKGQVEKARKIADQGGEVYSYVGLEAKAAFLEGTTNYSGAFEWYAKIEERYGEPAPLVAFCMRYQKLTGNTRFEPELKKRLKQVFPSGVMEKVSLSDFSAAPADGVLIQQQNQLLRDAGLSQGDVIVALDGVRTHNFSQYVYVRGLLTGPELVLIVWQNGRYREVKASPPNHQFGASFGDYPGR